MNFYSRYPALFFAIFCFIGIQLSDFLSSFPEPLSFVLPAFFLSFMVHHLTLKKLSIFGDFISSSLILLNACSLGLMLGINLKQAEDLAYINCKNTELLGTLIEPPRDYFNNQELVLQLLAKRNGKEWIKSEGNLLVVLQGASLDAKAGDTLYCAGFLSDVRSANLSYLEYLQRKGIFYRLFTDKAILYKKKERSDHSLRKIKKSIASHIRLNFAQENSSVALALLLGDKEDLSRELKSAFSKAGASHLLAISGLHMGLIYALIWLLLEIIFPFYKLRIFKAYFLCVVLIFYALLTGFSPSVGRASLVLILVTLLKTHFARFQYFNLLGITALFQMILNPAMAKELGFQLSYIAVSGILVLFPIWRKYFVFDYSIFRWFSDGIGVSLSASLATAPLILIYFNTFPTHFLSTNIFIQPLAILIVGSGLGMILLESWTGIYLGMGYLCETLIGLLINGCKWISHLPYSQIIIDEFHWKATVVLGLEIFSWGLILVFFKKLNKKLDHSR